MIEPSICAGSSWDQENTCDLPQSRAIEFGLEWLTASSNLIEGVMMHPRRRPALFEDPALFLRRLFACRRFFQQHCEGTGVQGMSGIGLLPL